MPIVEPAPAAATSTRGVSLISSVRAPRSMLPAPVIPTTGLSMLRLVMLATPLVKSRLPINLEKSVSASGDKASLKLAIVRLPLATSSRRFEASRTSLARFSPFKAPWLRSDSNLPSRPLIRDFKLLPSELMSMCTSPMPLRFLNPVSAVSISCAAMLSASASTSSRGVDREASRVRSPYQLP